MPADSDGPTGPVDPFDPSSSSGPSDSDDQVGSTGPAASAATALPRTYRPLGARIATSIAAVAIVLAVGILWALLPGDVQDEFSWGQRITLLGFFAVVLVLLNGIFRTSARATDEGLRVINGYRRHDLVWGQVVRLSLTPNRPWALIDLDDGTTMAVMAIQSADGMRATRAARELAGVIARQTRTDRDT